MVHMADMQPQVTLPLWILAPGSTDTAEGMVHMADMQKFAEEHAFAFAALQGEREMLSVSLHAGASPGLPDDVRYTRAVLQEATQKLCIDMARIRCTGFSRGARFCSRLASELSSFVAGVAPVGGLRYPFPNNATRPVPIVTFHGTKDPINPYWGDGDPEYWRNS